MESYWHWIMFQSKLVDFKLKGININSTPTEEAHKPPQIHRKQKNLKLNGNTIEPHKDYSSLPLSLP